MKSANKKQQWKTRHLPTHTNEDQFIQKQIQSLLKKALVTIETTLNDHSLPSSSRLDASLKMIALFQGNLDISEDTLDSDHSNSSKKQLTTGVENTPVVAFKQAKLSEEELELEELRAVLDHSSTDETVLFKQAKLSKKELGLDELQSVL